MQSFFYRFSPAAFLLCGLLASCASNEIGQSRDVAPESVYQGYLVDHDEKLGRTVITAQFRFAGEAGTTLVLNPPSVYQLNGQPVAVDSSSLSGAYYRVEVPAREAKALYRFRYVGHNGQEYLNTAEIVPFRFKAVPEQARRDRPLCLEMEFPRLEAGDNVELYSTGTDSSFSITHYSRDSGNSLCIPLKEMQRQRGKQFSVYAVLNRRRSLAQHTSLGGEISIAQTLQPVEIRLAD